MRRYPPLQLIPAFEACARLGSFKKAADELHVTPSAISQQIRALETAVGVHLFDRLTRRVVLTRAGTQLHEMTARLLEEYAQSYRRFREQHDRPVLRVSMVAFVAYEMVLPRLHEFQSRHPDIDLRIETSMALADFSAEPIDCAIRYSAETDTVLASLPLAVGKATLVAAPALLEKQPIRTLADLGNYTLIHMRRTPNDWEEVTGFLRLKDFRPRDELFLDDYFSAMLAAKQGLGLAIAILPISNGWIKNGSLVAPFPVAVKTNQSYQLVCRKDRVESLPIQAFYAWIRGIFEETGGGFPG